MGEAAQSYGIALIKSRCRKILLDTELRDLYQLKICMLRNSELLNVTQICLVKSLLNEFKKVHLCLARYYQH